MKIEIRCPSCDKGFLVDEKSRGGELLCPSCLTRIDLGSGTPTQTGTPPTAPPKPEAAPDVQPPVAAPVDMAIDERPLAPPVIPTETTQPTPAERAVGSRALPTESSTVVCPRCELHFEPCAEVKRQSTQTRKTVLIVEDLEYFRQVAADALAADYEVRLAKNVTEARSAIDRGGIDLLVLDLTLEGGEEGMLFLQEIQPKQFPILIFTAQDESDMYGDSWEKLQALGADDIVIKGMNVEESLSRKVDILLGFGGSDIEPMGNMLG